MSILGRGEFGTAKIAGEDVYGFYLDPKDVDFMSAILSDHMDTIGWSLTDEQKTIVERLFFHTGLAESCYPAINRVFSVAKQIGGPAIGFIQIEPETAISVLTQAINAIPGSDFYKKMDRAIDLHRILEWVNKNPIGALNDIPTSLAIFRLKLGNRGFRGVPGFRGDTNINPSLEDLAKTWKDIWNTELGAGTIEGFVEKNKTYMEMLGIEKI